MAKHCDWHWECGTTQVKTFFKYYNLSLIPAQIYIFHFQACSQSKCVDLCFSEDCNQEVNNARDREGWTPLHQAAWKNDVSVAELLIAHSANLNATVSGLTPLQVAQNMRNQEMVDLLKNA